MSISLPIIKTHGYSDIPFWLPVAIITAKGSDGSMIVGEALLWHGFAI